MNDETDLIDILINNFGRDKSLEEIGRDYNDLEGMIVVERASSSADPRRLAALNVLLRFELKLAREKLSID